MKIVKRSSQVGGVASNFYIEYYGKPYINENDVVVRR